MTEPITVKKYGARITVSCCAAGICQPGDHPALPRPPWRRRVRWWMARVWDRRPRVHLGPCRHEEDDW